MLMSDEAVDAIDTTIVDTRYERAEQPEDEAEDRRESPPETKTVTKAARQRRHATIVDNNVFCPSCKPPELEPEEREGPPGAARARTQLPLALLATMESDDPRASMATILDTELERIGVYLAGVTRGSVTLRAAGALEILAFPKPDEPKKKPKTKPKTKPKPKPKPKQSSREIDGAREAISCDNNACTVDRRFVDKLIANPALLARQAKIVPAVKDGETRGFRIYRVRRGTIPKLLGLRNGDTLLDDNGTELDSMDRAIGLYTKLRRASNLSFTIERKGKVFEKHVSIR